MQPSTHKTETFFEDHLLVGMFITVLHPVHSVTLVASLDPDVNLDGASAYVELRIFSKFIQMMCFWKELKHELPGNSSLS